MTDNDPNNAANTTTDTARSEKLRANLSQFTGSEQWYRHPLNRSVTYTDGAKAFADEAGAYWLFDIFATELFTLTRQHEIIFITCDVKNGKAELYAKRDADQPNLWQRSIAFTDCPEGSWPFWMASGGPLGTVVILLPSEY